jgi:hypothetical protein
MSNRTRYRVQEGLTYLLLAALLATAIWCP